MTTDIESALLPFGLLRPANGLGEAVEALEQTGPAAAARLLHRHKAAHLARANTRALIASGGPQAGALRELADELGRLRTVSDAKIETATAVIAALAEALPDVPARLMKGLAARDWYPADQPRDVGDADLWVPDLDSAWQIAGVLRSLGYEYESAELPWVKADALGRPYGQIRMLARDGARVAVDIHAGPYSVRYCGLLHFAKSADGAAWQPLAWEDNLLSVVANAAGDCFIDLKTVNDVERSLAQPLDFGYIADRLAHAELSGFLAALLTVVEQTIALQPEQAHRLNALHPRIPAEPLRLTAAPDPDVRLDLVVEHTRRAGLRLTASPEQSEQLAAQAHRAYQEGKNFRLIKDRPGRGALPRLAPWTCVRLVPQPLVRRLFHREPGADFVGVAGTGIGEHLQVVRGEPGDLVLFGDEIFLPTVDYAFPVGLVDGVVS